jgi:ABC-type cobalamin/Fe3+-siderophores transport system ATPase subunit
MLPREEIAAYRRKTMSVKEIQDAITALPPAQLADLLAWIEQFEHDAWDVQIARDVKAGRFEHIRQRVHEQRDAGLCRPLEG